MFVNWKKSLLWALALTVALSTTTVALAAKGGNKGKPAPPAELPPVRYQIQFFSLPDSTENEAMTLGANNLGQAVGAFGGNAGPNARAFLYDPLINIDQAIDLNEIVDGIPGGWAIRKAKAINHQGDIAVFLMPIGSSGGDYQAAMIDMNVDPPQLHIIPDSDLTSHSLACDMNDLGDIVVKYKREDGTWGLYVYNFGLYDDSLATSTLIDLDVTTMSTWPKINNSMQVVSRYYPGGDTFRATPGDTTFEFETFPGLVPESFNNLGEFGGLVSVELKGNKTGTRPFIMGSELEVFPSPDYRAPAHSLNDTSDFSTRRHLYHRTWGYVNPVDLLDPNDPNTVTWNAIVESFEIWKISNRDDTDFFKVFGSVNNATLGFVLTPVAAP